MIIKEIKLRNLIKKIILETINNYLETDESQYFEDFKKQGYYKELALSWGESAPEPSSNFLNMAGEQFKTFEEKLYKLSEEERQELFAQYDSYCKKEGEFIDHFDLDLFIKASDEFDEYDRYQYPYDNLALAMVEYAHLRYKINKRKETMKLNIN